MITCAWLSYRPDESPADKWDAGDVRRWVDEIAGIEHLYTDTLVGLEDGAIVVFPAGVHSDQMHVQHLFDEINAMRWCVLFLTADEQSLFPIHYINLPHVHIVQQTPVPIGEGTTGQYADEFIGYCLPPQGHAILERLTAEANASVDFARPFDWMFSGQVTHDHRKDAAMSMQQVSGGYFKGTSSFANTSDGLEPELYYERMSQAKIIPCPSGPATPDSFRAWEALEAGCLPILDGTCRDYDTPGYWDLVAPNLPPTVPVLDNWSQFPGAVATALNAWPANANQASAWWQMRKRTLRVELQQTIHRLSGIPTDTHHWDERQVTVLMPTSPCPAHPSTEVIEETIESVRAVLPTAEIIVMIDGLRSDLAAHREAYDEYIHRLLRLTEHRWKHVTPFLHDTHRQQSGMTRMALRLVRTPYLMFVEHDTPVIQDPPIQKMIGLIREGYADVVRLYPFTDIEPAHLHMMIDDERPVNLGSDDNYLPVTRTWQWSQRPHITSTAYYRDVVLPNLDDKPRFIEEVMAGVCAGAFTEHGMVGWHRHRLVIYNPGGNIQTSTHLDGRGADPEYLPT